MKMTDLNVHAEICICEHLVYDKVIIKMNLMSNFNIVQCGAYGNKCFSTMCISKKTLSTESLEGTAINNSLIKTKVQIYTVGYDFDFN